MTAFVSKMGTTYGITYTVSPAATASGTKHTLYTVTVAASGSIANAVMKIGGNTSKTVNTTSTAENPVYTMTLTLAGVASSAYDIDALYYYVVPSDNSVPTSSAMTQFYTNTTSTYTKSFTVQLTAGQKVWLCSLQCHGWKSRIRQQWLRRCTRIEALALLTPHASELGRLPIGNEGL